MEELDIPDEVPDMREPLGEWADKEIVIEDKELDQEEMIKKNEEILATPPKEDIYEEKKKPPKQERGGGYWF